MAEQVVILGATGSIGTSTLDVIRHLDGRFRAAAVTAHTSWEKLADIALEFNPDIAVIGDEQFEQPLKDKLSHTSIEVVSGSSGLTRASCYEKGDIFITGIAGGIGLQATVNAVRTGKRVGVANKEPFVMAGRLISEIVQETGCEIIPVDSEHSAIFQCLLGEESREVNKVYITGSGGPFRTWPIEKLSQATKKDALNHPTWDMGPKVTVDSATMMNKALELLEARWLFSLSPSQIDVIIHPQSIIHSMVEFCDGSIKAQMGNPDMTLPIQYALTYPERTSSCREYVDFLKVGSLTFEQPDPDKYPALRIGREMLHKKGDRWGTIINSANEVAVDLFLNEKISFTEITQLIEKAVAEFASEEDCTFEEIIALDNKVRSFLKKEYICDN
ncbi:1-deoxy-D-xylulose-5-phosphate reductoisomerase [Planctomycetota bacterium]